MPIIKQKDFIIVEYDNKGKCHQMVPNGKIKISRNVYIKTDQLVGTSFNKTYLRNGDGSLREIDEKTFFQELKGAIMPNEDEKNYEANNEFSKMNMNESAQRLTDIDIHNLKTKDPSIIELIQYIVKGSLTFESKNPFSQEKYLRKKLLKFLFHDIGFKVILDIVLFSMFMNQRFNC